jgi:hypothetical protein
VSVLDLTASGERKSTTGNTLTVAFEQSGVEALQALVDARDAACKTAPTSQKCLAAKQKLADATSIGGGMGFMMLKNPNLPGFKGSMSPNLPAQGVK